MAVDAEKNRVVDTRNHLQDIAVKKQVNRFTELPQVVLPSQVPSKMMPINAEPVQAILDRRGMEKAVVIDPLSQRTPFPTWRLLTVAYSLPEYHPVLAGEHRRAERLNVLRRLFLSPYHASGQGVKELNLSPWALNDPTVASILLRAPSLTSLSVAGKAELDAQALGDAILRRAQAETGAGPSKVAPSTGLTSLDLSRGMRDVPIVLQTAAAVLRATLRHLSLRRCPGLSTNGIRIVAVGGFSSLLSLDLSGNPGVRDLTLLEIAVGCPQLELLNCNKWGLGGGLGGGREMLELGGGGWGWGWGGG